MAAALLLAFLLWLALVLAGMARLAKGPREGLVVFLGEGSGELEFFLRRLAARANARRACTSLVVVVDAPAGAAQKMAGALGRKCGFTVLLAGEGGGEFWEAAGGGRREAPGRGRACTSSWRVYDARGLGGKELLDLAAGAFGPEN